MSVKGPTTPNNRHVIIPFQDPNMEKSDFGESTENPRPESWPISLCQAQWSLSWDTVGVNWN